MYYCDKCGEIVRDVNKSCPTCGMIINGNVVNNKINKRFNNKLFNILIILIVVFGIFVGIYIFSHIINYSPEEIEIIGDNYSVFYQTSDWIESDLSTSEYYILQNTYDLDAYLQLPKAAVELNLNLENSYDRDNLHATYDYLLRNDIDYNYYNITSKFISINNTNNYYMSSDFYKHSDSSLKGKVFIVVSSEGKVINILLKKGSKNFSSILEGVFELLEKIAF